MITSGRLFNVLAFAICIAFTTTIASAQRALPADTEQPLEMDIAEQIHGWLEPMLLDAYREHGHRDDAWDEAAEQFIREFAHLLTPSTNWHWYGNDEEGRKAAALETAEQLLGDGADDPLLHLAAAYTALETGDRSKAFSHAGHALDGYEQHPYPAFVQALAAVHKARLQDNEENNDRAIGLLLDVLTDRQWTDGREQGVYRVLFLDMAERLSRGALRRLGDRLSAEEDRVAPWLYHIVRGEIHRQLGWEARGTSFASGVTPDQWRRFRQEMEVAQEHLVEAHRLEPERPEAAGIMTKVAHAWSGADRSARAWFDETVAAQFDYRPAYYTLLDSLLPRWGGSHQALMEFAQECVDTRRYDTAVPFQALNVYNWIIRDMGSHERMVDMPLYNLLDQMFLGYYDFGQGFETRNRSRRIALAWRYGRYARAYRLYDEAEPDEISDHWLSESFGGDAATIRSQVVAYGGPTRHAFRDVNEAIEDGDYAQAVEMLEQLAQQHQDLDFLADYLHVRIEVITMRRDFEAGQTVDLPRDLRAGWSVELGAWGHDDRGDLTTIAERRPKLLIHELDLPPRFEFTGQAEFSYWTRLEGFRNGPSIVGDEGSRLTFAAELNQNRVQLRPRRAIDREARYGTVYRFRVIVFDDRLVYEIDNQRIFDSTDLLPYSAKGHLRIGIGDTFGHSEMAVTFRDLQVRSIESVPDEPSDYSEPLDEPILHYDFTEGLGEGEHHLPNHGAFPLPMTFRYNAAMGELDGVPTLRFNGDTAFTCSFFHPGLENWTMSAWIRGDDAPAEGSQQAVINYDPAAIFWNHPDARSRGALRLDTAEGPQFATFGPLEGEVWHHLVASWDGEQLRTYRDGNPVSTLHVAADPAERGSHAFRIGRYPARDTLEAHMAGARLYNRALDSDEVKQLHADRPARLPE